MAESAKLKKIGREGFGIIDQWKGRKSSSAPHKPTPREAIDCNQAAKIHGGVVFTTQIQTKYAYVPWNKAIFK
ncbi:hypothetical protein AAC387_Pa10g1837 [Persea americana]